MDLRTRGLFKLKVYVGYWDLNTGASPAHEFFNIIECEGFN